MNSRLSLLLPLFLLLPLPAVAAGGAAAAAARIEGQVALAKTADLYFANIAPGRAASYVVVHTNGNRSCGPGLACSGVVAPAAFSVSAAPNMSYAISLPATVTLSNGTGSMTASDFRASRPVNTARTDRYGQDSFRVGARLSVGIGQPGGTYVGSFDVSIDYN